MFERFFKGRYYPRCKINEAPVSVNPSYVWRNIIGAKEVVLSVARWRIGNGDEVKIWEDNWIPTIPCFKPLGLAHSLEVDRKVYNLIDTDMRMWGMQVLRANFDDHDVAINILRLRYRLT